MSTLITNNLKLFSADNFVESFTEPGFNVYYFYVGNPLPFDNDNEPPVLLDSVKETHLDPYENMIYGKRITSNDVAKLVRRVDWTNGEIYSKYTHDDGNLFQSNFFVVVDETTSYSVFKCLDNNNGSPSTDAPQSSETSPDDDFYFTSDGYQWKYMYSITPSQLSKFGTPEFIPVLVNQNVVSNSINGSIDNIEVTFGGVGYLSYQSGAFQEVKVGGNPLVYAIEPTNSSSNSNFYTGSSVKITSGTGSGQIRRITAYTVSGQARRIYIDEEFDPAPTTSSSYEISPYVTITGDGSGAKARAIVNTSSNTIYKIEVVNRGVNYSYADVQITGNTGTAGITVENQATAKIILTPQGGHGSNAAAELASHHVGISVEFDSTLSGNKVVDENDFRTIGIIKDPLFANVVIGAPTATRVGTFEDGEVVTQTSGYKVAGIVVTNPGSGYAANATVTVTGTSIQAASANAQSNSSGRISSVLISNNGIGYDTAPSISISAPSPVSVNAASVNSTADFVTIPNNVFQNNDYVKYLVSAGNTAISGISNNSNYWVVSSNSTGVKLSSSRDGSAINLTAGSSETGHTLTGDTATAAAVLNLDGLVTACGVVYSIDSNYIKLSNAYGFFTTGNTTVKLLVGQTSGATAVVANVTQPTTYFDQTYKIVAVQPTPNFQEDELVVQASNANGYFYSSNSTVMRIVNKKGTINQSDIGGTSYFIDGVTTSARAEVTGTIPGDLVRNTGDVIYVENFVPVVKSAGQKETIKLILDF